MVKVKFTFEDKSISEQVIEGEFKGESILDIAEDADIHLNHNCGAVCACSTCHVYVDKGEDQLQEISDREEDFIDRAKREDCSEGHLEMIQAKWVYEWRDNQ